MVEFAIHHKGADTTVTSAVDAGNVRYAAAEIQETASVVRIAGQQVLMAVNFTG